MKTLVAFLSVILIAPSFAFAAIAFDVSTAGVGDGTTFTTTAADTIAIVGYGVNATGGTNPQAVSCTNGCGSATLVDATSMNASFFIHTYWIHITSSGSHTITLPNLNGNAQIISYTGVDSTTPIDQHIAGSGTSLTLTGVVANAWLYAHWDTISTSNILNGGLIIRRNGANGGTQTGDTNASVTAGNYTQSWTQNTQGTEQYLSLKPAASAATATFQLWPLSTF